MGTIYKSDDPFIVKKWADVVDGEFEEVEPESLKQLEDKTEDNES